MKIKTENIDFECPCCKDPYSQCPFFTYKKKRKKSEIDWETVIRKSCVFFAHLLLFISFIVTIIHNYHVVYGV